MMRVGGGSHFGISALESRRQGCNSAVTFLVMTPMYSAVAARFSLLPLNLLILVDFHCHAALGGVGSFGPDTQLDNSRLSLAFFRSPPLLPPGARSEELVISLQVRCELCAAGVGRFVTRECALPAGYVGNLPQLRHHSYIPVKTLWHL